MSTAATDAKPLRIVLSGYFGFHNLGDEAILESVCENLRCVAPGTLIQALVKTPFATGEAPFTPVPRMSPLAIWRALRNADLFISGGGSLLQDVTGPGSVPYYLSILEMARLAGVPRMILAQGVGPLASPWSRRLVGQVVSGVDVVTVRDQASADLLVACGVPPDRIALTVDPVLGMAPHSGATALRLLEGWGLNVDKPIIAISIRPWKSWLEKQLKSFSAVLAQCALAWDAQILLLPFHKPADDWMLDELAQCLNARPESQRPCVKLATDDLTAKDMLAVLQAVDLLIGMRLHALIMAAAVHTPALGIVYDPKIAAFAEQAQMPTMPSVESLGDSETLGQALHRAWEQRDRQRDTLRSLSPAWRAAIDSNTERAISLARSSRGR